MKDIFQLKYFKYGFLHYWYTDKRKVALIANIPFFLLMIIFTIIADDFSSLGIFIIIILDLIFIPLIIGYFIVLRPIIPLENLAEDIDLFIMEESLFIIIFFIIGRFLLNIISEKNFEVDLSNKSKFKNSTYKIFKRKNND